MALLKLTKTPRPYILKSETESFYDQLIEKAKQELEASPEKSAELSAKISQLQSDAAAAKAKLDKYGPTIWSVKSASKADIKRKMAAVNISLGKAGSLADGEFTSAQLAYVGLMAYEIAKLGLVGWSNLRDENGQEIPFDQSLIEYLPEEIVSELAAEISGQVGEEDAKN